MTPSLHFVPFCPRLSRIELSSLFSIASLIFILLSPGSYSTSFVLFSFLFFSPSFSQLKSPASHAYWHYVIVIVE